MEVTGRFLSVGTTALRLRFLSGFVLSFVCLFRGLCVGLSCVSSGVSVLGFPRVMLEPLGVLLYLLDKSWINAVKYEVSHTT